MRSSVGAKRRKFWLIAASALASSSLGVSEPALAQCSGTCQQHVPATCSANTLYQRINVMVPTHTPINLTLQPGVNVTIPTGSPGVNAVNAANTRARL